MRIFFAASLLAPALAALSPLAAHAAPVASSGVSAPSAQLPSVRATSKGAVEAAIKSMLLSPAWREIDPGFVGVSRVVVSAHKMGPRFVARATPMVDGVAVNGADRVFVVGDEGIVKMKGVGVSLRPVAPFAIDEHTAMLAAFDGVKGGLVGDVSVERVNNVAHRVWLSTDGGLRPAWLVRVPTWRLEDLKDVLVDANTGAVLQRLPVAKLGVAGAPSAAKVFTFAPDAAGLDVADLVDVNLVGLRGVEGDPLRGDHFETSNCCKFVVCNDASTTCLQNLGPGETANDVATCASQQDIDDGLAVESVIQPENGIPRDSLPIPAQFANFVPDPVFVKIVFCAEIPKAHSAPADGENPAGWFFTPVDGDRGNATKCGEAGADPVGCAAEVDEFAEVQVYHATQVFFEHVRTVLDDGAFCLGGQSQQCEAGGGPTLGDDNEPLLPFHISTNVLFPNIDFNDLAAQLGPPPLGQGRGADAGNPVVIEDFQRLPNAAFIPALEGGPIQIPPELQALASLFSRPFDSNVYFQGSRDFAYDGDVVRHEFTHAIVHSFVPGLGSQGFDAFGTHAESGGLNEGWADYFSSSFIGNPTVGDYAGQGLPGAEAGLRDNDNQKKCPDDIIGEVHADSEHWAGALWAIREEHRADGGDINALDLALLEALALADNDEDMTRAAAGAVDAIRSSIGDELADFAAAEFASRGVSECFRVWPLAVVNEAGDGITVTRKDVLFQPGTADVGLANFAPSVMQFRIDVPAGSAGFTLRWQQAAGGGGLGGGGGEAPMAVAVAEVAVDDATAAIEWRYEGAAGNLAVPYDQDGQGLDFNEDESAVSLGAADNNGVQAATFTQTLESDACNARSFVVSLVALDGGAQLANIDVDNIATDAVCAPAEGEGEGEGEAPEGCPCSGGTAPPSSLALFAGALLVLRRRRRRH